MANGDDDATAADGTLDTRRVSLVPPPLPLSAADQAWLARNNADVQHTDSTSATDNPTPTDDIFAENTFTPPDFNSILSTNLDQLGDLLDVPGPTGGAGGAEGSLSSAPTGTVSGGDFGGQFATPLLNPVNAVPGLSNSFASDQALRSVAEATFTADTQGTPITPNNTAAPTNTSSAPSAVIDKNAVMQTLNQQGLRFEQNVGQIDSSYNFVAHMGTYSVALSPTEAVMAVTPVSPSGTTTADSASSPTAQVTLGMQLVGANPNATPVGQNVLPGLTNYLSGEPSQTHTGIVSYGQAAYQNVYNGIDAVYHSSPNTSQLEYDFVVAPGANANQVTLAFQGTQGVSIDPQGQLVLQTALGNVVQQQPVAYQDIGETRQTVSSAFSLDSQGQVHFALGNYDPAYALTIDPTFAYSSYLGGNLNDTALAVAAATVPPQNPQPAYTGVFVVGQTSSPTFRPADVGRQPVQPTTIQNPINSNMAYAIQLNASTNDPVYLDYFAGTVGQNPAVSAATAVTADTNGNAYLAGYTNATNFPTTNAAWQGKSGGGNDAFAATLNVKGLPIWSTYLGGAKDDSATAIALDNNGKVYVGGVTSSPNFNGHAPDATTSKAVAGADGTDGFVARLSAQQGILDSLVLVNGSNDDGINGLAFVGGGKVYVAGYTASADTLTNIPGPANQPFQATNNGGNQNPVQTAFVGEFLYGAGAVPLGVVYATYFGPKTGISSTATAIAVNPATGDAFVVGSVSGAAGGVGWGNAAATISPTVLGNAGGQNDAWAAKFDPTGNPNNQPYFVYLAGNQNDVATSIAFVANGGNLPPYMSVAGYTNSNDSQQQGGGKFPATGGPNKLQGGFNQGVAGATAYDGFLALLNPSATNAQGQLDATQSINFLGYIGGTADDKAYGVALDPGATNAWVAGTTWSTDFRAANVAGMQQVAGGGANNTDGFVVSVAP